MNSSKNASKKSIGNRRRVAFFRAVNSSLENIQSCRTEQNQNSNNEQQKISFQSSLQHWAIKYKINGNAMSALLKILIAAGFQWLPLNSKSFLSTPRHVEIKEVSNGKFWYNGVAKNLKLIFSKLSKEIAIQMNFNVDGLPLFNSSKIQFWPILAAIHGKFISHQSKI